MNRIVPVSDIQLTQNPKVLDTIERLNAAHYNGQISNYFQIEQSASGMPLSFTWPIYGEHTLPAYDHAVVRFYGTANGHHLVQQKMADLLVATTVNAPVVGVPYSSRSWTAKSLFHHTKGWHGTSGESRDQMSDRVLRAHAETVYEALGSFDLPEIISVSGESLGMACGLWLADRMLANFDVVSVSGSAVPNIEPRRIYTQLLPDLYKASNMAVGGMRRQVLQGPLVCVPFALSHGFDPAKPPKTDWENLLTAGDYFLRDMIGKSLVHYRSNEALARAVCRPTAMDKITRLVFKQVGISLGVFSLDLVSKPEAVQAELARFVTLPNFEALGFTNRDHNACNNPYILAFMARKLFEPAKNSNTNDTSLALFSPYPTTQAHRV